MTTYKTLEVRGNGYESWSIECEGLCIDGSTIQGKADAGAALKSLKALGPVWYDLGYRSEPVLVRVVGLLMRERQFGTFAVGKGKKRYGTETYVDLLEVVVENV